MSIYDDFDLDIIVGNMKNNENGAKIVTLNCTSNCSGDTCLYCTKDSCADQGYPCDR